MSVDLMFTAKCILIIELCQSKKTHSYSCVCLPCITFFSFYIAVSNLSYINIIFRFCPFCIIIIIKGPFTPTLFGSDFSAWSEPKLQMWNPPRTAVRTKQPKSSPTKRSRPGSNWTMVRFVSTVVWKHFLDGSDFRTNYRIFWQAVVTTRKRKNNKTKWAVVTHGERRRSNV